MNQIMTTARTASLLATTVAAAFSFTATPAMADPIITPIIATIVASTLGEAAVSFTIFGVPFVAAVSAIVTTFAGRGLTMRRRK